MGHTKIIIQVLQNYLLVLQTLETLLTGAADSFADSGLQDRELPGLP